MTNGAKDINTADRLARIETSLDALRADIARFFDEQSKLRESFAAEIYKQRELFFIELGKIEIRATENRERILILEQKLGTSNRMQAIFTAIATGIATFIGIKR